MFDLEELKKSLEENNAERRRFIDFWIDFMEKNPNSVWSRQHADFLDMVYTKYEKK